MTIPKAVPPTVTQHQKDNLRESTETHPAYAVIGASRISSGGGDYLFGSDFKHHHYVVVTIARAESNRDLSRDWTFDREELIRVALSESQWATFVSTLNYGEGSECTLERFNGEMVPGILRQVDRRDQFAGELARTLEESLKEIDAIAAELKRRKLPEAVVKRVEHLRQRLNNSPEFVGRQFEKHMETTVDKAKGEIAAHMQAVVTRAGLKKLLETEPPTVVLEGKEVRELPEAGEEGERD